MKEFINRITRKSGTWFDFFPVAAILSVALAVFAPLVTGVFNLVFRFREIFDFISGDATATDFAFEYFMFFGIWVLIILVIFIFKRNRKMFEKLRYNGDFNSIKGLLFGALMGFGANAICVLMSLLLGDIKLSFYKFDIRIVLLFIFCVFVQSGAEELMDRLYLYEKLRRRYKNPLVAILGNALVFTLLHAFNTGFGVIAAIQLIVTSLIFSMFMYYYDALWLVMAFHAAWNFTQSIIFGLPNSGIVSAYSIFNLEAASARNGFFYNVNFGVEGSYGACLVLFIIAVVVYMLSRNKPEKNDLWKEYEIEKDMENLN